MMMNIFSNVIPFSLVDVNGSFRENCCPFGLCWTTSRYIPQFKYGYNFNMINLRIHRILDRHIDYYYYYYYNYYWELTVLVKNLPTGSFPLYQTFR